MTEQGAFYRNPVISGFYPDPSVVRVEDDYYLVTSSFEYVPGIPIFHSKDLVHWMQIGHVLTRPSQIDLRGRKSSEGIFAPTIRYHEGLFYVVTTDVQGIGNFVVTAERPEGPWSDPIRIPHANIDPSLMFDDDGKVYVTSQKGWGEDSHIILYELDVRTGEALSDPVVVCRGDGGVWTEGPHLYRIGGWYYLLCACGGTGVDHRAIAARSRTVYGPYELMDRPVLTHNRLPAHPIQNVGHADLVEDPNGQWWAVFLGVRPIAGDYSVLGRESFLAPVRWTEDGWPTIDDNEGTVGLLMQASGLPESARKESGEGLLDDFGDEELAFRWAFVRAEPKGAYSLTDRKGHLRLRGTEATLSDSGVPAFLAMRQRHAAMDASIRMDFAPDADGEEAGLAVRYDESSHCWVGMKRIDGELCLVASRTIDGVTTELARRKAKGSSGYFKIRSDVRAYRMLCSEDGERWTELAQVPAKLLSPEHNGGFTGVCLGPYATGNGRPSGTDAWFDWFRYEAIREGARGTSL